MTPYPVVPKELLNGSKVIAANQNDVGTFPESIVHLKEESSAPQKRLYDGRVFVAKTWNGNQTWVFSHPENLKQQIWARI